jgi:apolipoprotein N-acyltransferase
VKEILKKPLLVSLLAGVFIALPWLGTYMVFGLFLGMFLFLISAQQMIENQAKGFKFFAVLYLGFLVWNLLATWWIYHATVGGFLMAVLANSALMTIPFFAYRAASHPKTEKYKLPIFILTWLCFEFVHHNWSLSWPWLSLGNAFAKVYPIIQWYEITGTAGGSLWVLALSSLGFNIYSNAKKENLKYAYALVLVPIIVSLTIFYIRKSSLDKNTKYSEICVVQPNINTYTQKSSSGELYIPYDEQLEICLNLAKQKLTSKTEFLALPETAINGNIIESQLIYDSRYQMLMNFLKAYPNLTIVAGLDSYDLCKDQSNPREYASYYEGFGYYEPYNSALIINQKGYQIYHKNKFVPGAEQVPIAFLMKPIEKILGGVGFGHFFGQEDQLAYEGLNQTKIAPSICYESIFGEHMAEFVHNGANILFILTNDDWWHDTDGHRHHYEYARLRAIETRLAIARSANTGFSGYFDALGRDYQKTNYREPASLLESLPLQASENQTIYVKFGDYIGKIASALTIVSVLFLVFIRIKK